MANKLTKVSGSDSLLSNSVEAFHQKQQRKTPHEQRAINDRHEKAHLSHNENCTHGIPQAIETKRLHKIFRNTTNSSYS
eukprot:2936194-Amphidinium_carterae.1